MRGAILPLPQYDFMAWCSVKKTQGLNLNSKKSYGQQRSCHFTGTVAANSNINTSQNVGGEIPLKVATLKTESGWKNNIKIHLREKNF
jgi:hypothetical protein